MYIGDFASTLNISHQRATRMVQRAWTDGRKARFRFERAIRKLTF